VPVPAALLDALDLVHGIRDRKTRARLWTWSLKTAYTRVIEVMEVSSGGVSNVDIDRNNTLQIKSIEAVISTFETLPIFQCALLGGQTAAGVIVCV
jgi:predicted flavoprotein YhiN